MYTKDGFTPGRRTNVFIITLKPKNAARTCCCIIFIVWFNLNLSNPSGARLLSALAAIVVVNMFRLGKIETLKLAR